MAKNYKKLDDTMAAWNKKADEMSQQNKNQDSKSNVTYDSRGIPSTAKEYNRSSSIPTEQKVKSGPSTSGTTARNASTAKKPAKPDEEQVKEKETAKNNYQSYLDEANRLTQEKETKSQIYENGIYVGMDKKTSDWYDGEIQRYLDLADAELAKINTSDSERDKVEEKYNKAVEDEYQIAGWATDPITALLADEARENRKDLEEELKDENRKLGNDTYYGLAPEAQPRDLFEGWYGERLGSGAMALGTGLQWLDATSDEMTRYEYDQEHGEGAYDAAIAGKNVNQIGDAGGMLWDAGVQMYEQAQSDWESGTEDMSETGQQIMGLTKAGADMTADMVDNFILPGLGRIAMGIRVGGQGAYTQSKRENNDIDARFGKMLLDGASAYLSEYLIGGAEAVYGKSILGKGLDRLVENASPAVKWAFKTFLNTEWLEEGLEYALNYAGDKYLGLEQNAEFNKGEFNMEMLYGYILGTVFNGLAGGISYDATKLRNVVDQAFIAAESNLTPAEVTKAALMEPDENIKIDPSKQVQPEVSVAPAEQARAVAPSSEETTAEEQNAEPEPEPAPEPEPEPEQVIPPEPQAPPASPEREAIRAIIDRGSISLKEAAQIRNTPELAAAFEQETGKSLAGLGEKAAADLIRSELLHMNRVQNIESGITEANGEFPNAEPGFDNEPTREYEKAQAAMTTVTDLLAGDALSKKDASKIVTDKTMWAAFGEAIGIDTEKIAPTVKNAQELFREAKKNETVDTEQDVAGLLIGEEPSAETSPAEARAEQQAPTAEQMLLAEEETPSDAQNEPVANPETEQGNIPPEAEKTADEGLTESESNEQQNAAEGSSVKPDEETAKWHGLNNVIEDDDVAAIQKIRDTDGLGNWTDGYNVYSREGNNFRYFTDYDSAKAYYDSLHSTHTETKTNPNGNANTQNNSNVEDVNAAFDALNQTHGSIEPGEKPARDINVPKKDTAGNKVGEGARTIFEAEATPEERLGSLKAAVVNGDFGHVPVTNDARSTAAANKIARDGWKKSVGDFLGAVRSGKVDADTIALGAHLLNEAGNSPECTGRDYVELAMAYNEAASHTGQALAAARILKTLTPEGKLYGFEKTVEKINDGIRKNNAGKKPGKQKPEVKLNEDLAEKYLKAKTEEERSAVHDEMVNDIAKQVPNTLRDKFTSLRYLNMLGNFKTQVRNIVGNIGMTATQKVKNEIVSAIEGIASLATNGKYERQYKGFYGTDLFLEAKADFGSDEALRKTAMGEGKYSDVGKQAESEIKEAQKPFSDRNPLGKFLNLYSKATTSAMEFGDLVFVRANYADALAGYMNAHGITAAEWAAMVKDPARAGEVDKARNYAIKQAQEATFRDTNSVSKFVSTIDNRWPRLAKAISQGVIPFRKTPANVLVRMEEYSPLGFVNTAVNAAKAAKGTGSASDVIDSFAKSVTGTALTALGYYLRSKGMARTKDKDDKAEKLAKLRGQQDYSIEFTLPNGKRKSFTLDWLTPDSGAFFMGVELYNLIDDGGITPSEAMSVLSSFTNPMLEMSMLSGVNDALSNLSDFEGDNSAMAQFVLNSAWSYLTQGISNTMLGQAEQFSEDYRQTYYTDADNPLLTTSSQKKLAKLGNKTPGFDYQAADYIDAWGRKQENTENKAARAFNVFANPGYVSDMTDRATEADDVIEMLYQFGKEQTEKDSFPDVVPKSPSRSTTVNGTKLTPEEYEVYATTKGQEALDAVIEFSESDLYKDMDNFDRAETISEIYSFSEFLAASKIAESRGEEYYDDRYSPLITGETEDGEDTYKTPIKEEDIPEYLAFKTAYNSAMNDKDYDVVDALLDSVSSLPASARTGALQHAQKMETLTDLKDAGLSSTKVYYQFQDDMKTIYEGEKRTAPKSSDYIRVAGSGKYSPEDADAIMAYETKVSEQTVAGYQDQVRYNLEKADMGNAYNEVWSKVQAVADGNMTTDQLKSYVEKNVPLQYRQAIRDVASNYAEDRHVAGKTVSGIYNAVRSAGYSPEQALKFYEMIDTNYNGRVTKKELAAACNAAFPEPYRSQIRKSIEDIL